jgi:hypothetical protein
MSHRRRTPHEDAGDTEVLAGAQSPPDGDQFPGVDPGSGYDGKHDRIEPQRRSSYSVGEGATELAVLHRSAAGASPSTGNRIVSREMPGSSRLRCVIGLGVRGPADTARSCYDEHRTSKARSADLPGCPGLIVARHGSQWGSADHTVSFFGDGYMFLPVRSVIARKISKCLQRSRPRPEIPPLTWAFTRAGDGNRTRTISLGIRPIIAGNTR